MNPLCQIQGILSDPLLPLWVCVLIVGGLAIYFFTYFYRQYKHKNPIYHLLFGFSCIIFFITLSILSALFLIITQIIPLDDGRPSAAIHQMNAAIKNTCLIDPLRNNCPKNLDEVMKLYPQEFTKLTERYVFTYQYYPEKNQYTLIARPKNLRLSWNKVALFDPRLQKIDTPYDTSGVDFADTPIYQCGTKYNLVLPPLFPGPWNKIN